MLEPTRFRFLNEERDVVVARDWNASGATKLWLYNLHYFDDLNAHDAARRGDWHRHLIARWVVENPPGVGNGWEPYPLSLRIVNWIKWALSGNQLDKRALGSLSMQVRFLKGRLERHLMGNHLFANAKALVFAGCFFEGKEATGWRRIGLDILAREIPEQILADGGHFERSTMYHALAYEDMLDLVNLAKAFPDVFLSGMTGCRNRLDGMGRWLRIMCHPDGEIAFFNDAAIGVAPAPADLFAYAKRLGHVVPEVDSDVLWLKESGYIRLRRGRALMLIDVAPLGPDYLPGHGHADTLSFELSMDEQRVIVNSGTSCYGLGVDREWERSTAAHTTVEVNHMDSSEVWAGFRVARRAYPFDVDVQETDAAITVAAAHDGYRRLAGRPIHRRIWRLALNGLTVSDEIRGRHMTAVARYHFHPRITIQSRVGHGRLEWGDSSATYCVEIGNAHVSRMYYAPAFGERLDNACLELRAVAGRVVLALSWS